MAGCHNPLCFTYNRALRHFKMCIACVCRGSALGRHSLKTPTGVHVLKIRTCSIYKIMLEHAKFKHGFRLARTIGFRTENRVDSFIFKQKLVCEHLDHSKNRHAWYPLFCYRKCRRTLLFLKEIASPRPNFLQKQKGAATISIKNRG